MKKYILTIGAFVGLLMFQSCADKLEVTPPNRITEEQIKDLMENGSDETRQKIMASIATPMIRYFNYSGISGGASETRYNSYQGLDHMRCLEGNDMVFGDNANGLFGMAEYQFQNFTGTDVDKNSAYWFGYAYAINQANMLLGYMTPEAAAASNLFKDGRARGLLVRAYSYMSLMENYQDAYLQGGQNKLGMSLYTEYNPLQESKARSSSVETYDFIKSDLSEAISMLSGAGIGYTTNDWADFDMGIAKFLQARACLWTGDYSTCISACNDIINSGAYSFIKEENYGAHNAGSDWTSDSIKLFPETNSFLCVRNNPECILGYTLTNSYNLNVFNTWLNAFSAGVGGSSRGFARIDDRLYNKIADNDFRKDAFRKEAIGDYYYASSSVTANIPSYINLKFASNYGLNQSSLDHTTKELTGTVEYCKFRLSEVYLMLAEAQLASGNESAAKTTLNTLLAARTKAGAETLTCDNYPSMAGMSTLEKIQLQWRIEMWGEGGREFFNNKRWNIPVDRNGSTNHVTITTYPVSGMTLQIPTREIQDNNLCVQN